MRALSLFSGVGGMDLGLERAGITTVALCEIDKHARSVLARHWPNIPIYDDVTTFDARSMRGTVDLVHGGSPCQDLSVAGRRAGLDGKRSSLFWHQCRIAAEVAAPWVLWENVAGALSSNSGRDFAAVLWGLTGTRPDVPAGGWRNMGIVVGPQRVAVWRLLDARWFGVPQRRRRVFVVSGPRAVADRVVEVLLEPACSRWDSQTRPAARQVVAAGAARCSDIHRRDEFVGSLTAMDGWERPDNAHAEAGWLLPVEVVAAFDSAWSGAYPISDDTSIAPTVKVGSGLGIASPPAVAFTDPNRAPAGQEGGSLAVRRLTPVECERLRLMGWPDNWTRWAADGTDIADSHRYRMCGNGVVSNVTEWIGERLMKAVQP